MKKPFVAARRELELRRRLGLNLVELTGTELSELEPALSPHFFRATLMPDNAYCTNPLHYVQSIGRHFEALQGSLLRGDVKAIETSGNSNTLRLADGRTVKADTIVLAAGVWTKTLLKPLGVRLLLEPHHGYNVVVHAPGVS